MNVYRVGALGLAVVAAITVSADPLLASGPRQLPPQLPPQLGGKVDRPVDAPVVSDRVERPQVEPYESSLPAGLQPVLSGSYGWEDGVGTILGSHGNVANPTNITFPEPVNSGVRALRVTHTPHGGPTPEVWVAFIEHLEHGDIIDASIFLYDDAPGGTPRMRIWATYALSGDIDAYAGSASGNQQYTAGIGYQQLGHTWAFDSGGGTRDALVIQARLYSGDPDCDTCATDYYIDDVAVNVYCAENPDLTITFPDGSVISGPSQPGPECEDLEACTVPDVVGDYGWEDGNGTIFSSTGNVASATNIDSSEGPVFEGNRSLKLVQTNPSGTPQAWVAFIEHLEDGDIIRAGFHGFTAEDDTNVARMRIWAHYGVSGNPGQVVNQAGGNETYTVPGEWDMVSNEWTFDSNFGQRDALMIQVRLYTGASAEFFVDDLWVEVCSENPNASVTFPDAIEPPPDPCDQPDLGAPVASGSYGWEDGVGTILGTFLPNGSCDGTPWAGQNLLAENIDDTQGPVNSGQRGLMLTEDPHCNTTPEAFVAYIENLEDGDVIFGSFHAWDDTPGTSPSVRIWAHYADSGDVTSFRGQAGGNLNFSSGIGWEELCHTWVFDSDPKHPLGPRDALVIKIRFYSTPSNCHECSTDYFIDDLFVAVWGNENATITLPGETPAPTCPWDLNDDNVIDVLDLLALLDAWGPNPGHPADFNGDGAVDVLDLLKLLDNWGPCP